MTSKPQELTRQNDVQANFSNSSPKRKKKVDRFHEIRKVILLQMKQKVAFIPKICLAYFSSWST